MVTLEDEECEPARDALEPLFSLCSAKKVDVLFSVFHYSWPFSIQFSRNVKLQRYTTFNGTNNSPQSQFKFRISVAGNQLFVFSGSVFELGCVRHRQSLNTILLLIPEAPN